MTVVLFLEGKILKKFFTLMIAVLLVFSCTITAFAADATPDELRSGVTSIKVVNVPKTSYSFMYDTDFDLTDEQWEDLLEIEDLEQLEAVFLSSFCIYLDLEDAEILATYSDGSSEYVNPDDCTATVLDMPTSFEEEEFFRDYTVQVEYMGCTDTYTINLYDDSDDFPEYESDYEFVSCVPPTEDVYVFEDCAYPASMLYPGLLGYFFDVDQTGMSVTLLNKATGELEVYSGDSIECYSVYVDPLVAQYKISSELYAFGEVITDDGEIVPFEFTVKLTFKDDTDGATPTNPQDNETDGEVSTPDSATNNSTTVDSTNNQKSPTVPTNALVGNKVVNTGEVFPATIVLVVVGCLAIGTLFIYRKRESK